MARGTSAGALIIVPAIAKRRALVEAPSWRFEAAGSRFYDQGRFSLGLTIQG